MVSSTSNSSDGQNKVTQYLYPIDYVDVPPGFINEMKAANIINKPIEEYTYVGGKVTGTLTEYKTGVNLGLPDVVYNLKSNDTPGSFTPSNMSGYTPSSDYEASIYFDRYSLSNIAQYHKQNDINISYLWGYNNTYPIVKGENIDYATLNSIFESVLTSFYTTVNPPVTKETFLIGMMTYPNGVNWKGFNSLLRSNATLAEKYISTYTYNPLIGMTSETDPNGKTTYYEYDSFGRLYRIKDHNGNILKQNTYHYANQ
jgi:YD repeat-containing protein